MSLFTNTVWRLLVLSAVLAMAAAQQCYLPDGSPSSDVPCTVGSGESSCCGGNEYCMANGLCFGAGLISRGSCTDQTWGSRACAEFCRTETEGAISPCPTSQDEQQQLFTCGTNTLTCSTASTTFTLPSNTTLLLRPSQLATFTNSTQSSPSSTPHTGKLYTPSAVAGLTLGLTLPLLLALLLTLHLLRLERGRHAGPKLMYKLPDNHSDFPRGHQGFQPSPSSYSLQSGYTASRRDSVGTMGSALAPTAKPAHFQSFVDKYGRKVRPEGGAVELDLGVPRWELDGVGAGHVGGKRKSGWVELPEKRASMK